MYAETVKTTVCSIIRGRARKGDEDVTRILKYGFFVVLIIVGVWMLYILLTKSTDMVAALTGCLGFNPGGNLATQLGNCTKMLKMAFTV